MTRATAFRLTDVKRAYKAALDAEMPNPRIVIETTAKTETAPARTRITIVPGPPADDDQTNEWDEVVTPQTDEARSK